MKPVAFASLLILVPTLTACATTGAGYQPVIDAPKDEQYYADLAECRQLASEYQGNAEQSALIGAGGGALVRGLSRNNSTGGVLGGAAIGALIGGTAGILSDQSEQKHILLSCMDGRGYRVLG